MSHSRRNPEPTSHSIHSRVPSPHASSRQIRRSKTSAPQLPSRPRQNALAGSCYSRHGLAAPPHLNTTQPRSHPSTAHLRPPMTRLAVAAAVSRPFSSRIHRPTRLHQSQRAPAIRAPDRPLAVRDGRTPPPPGATRRIPPHSRAMTTGCTPWSCFGSKLLVMRDPPAGDPRSPVAIEAPLWRRGRRRWEGVIDLATYPQNSATILRLSWEDAPTPTTRLNFPGQLRIRRRSHHNGGDCCVLGIERRVNGHRLRSSAPRPASLTRGLAGRPMNSRTSPTHPRRGSNSDMRGRPPR
jgi:hypothetical protein